MNPLHQHRLTFSNVHGTSANTLSLLSLAISTLAIPIYALSLTRIHTIHEISLEYCLLQETAFYRTIHVLCPILPAIAVTLSIIALLRTRKTHSRRSKTALGAVALLLALTGITAYTILLINAAAANTH